MAILPIEVKETGISQTNRKIKELDKNANKLTGSSKKVQSGFDSVSRSALKLTAAFGGLLIIDKITSSYIKNADAMTNVNSKLKLVTDSTQELLDTQEKIFNISQKTRSEFTSNVDLYQKMAFSTKELNLAQKEMLFLTSQINKELLISGTTAAGAETLIMQLGQAFSSNFQAVSQELNTIKDQAPSLYQTILAGTKMTAAEFKKAAEQGELSSEIIINAIKDQAKETDSNFAQIATTIDKAYGNVENSTEKLIGRFDEFTGASQSVSDTLIELSEFMDNNSDDIINNSKAVAYTAGTLAGLTLATKGYLATTAFLEASVLAQAGAFGALNRSLVLSAASQKALNIAMAASPYGAIIIGATALYEIYKGTIELQETFNENLKEQQRLAKGFSGQGVLMDMEIEKLDKEVSDAYDKMKRYEKALANSTNDGQRKSYQLALDNAKKEFEFKNENYQKYINTVFKIEKENAKRIEDLNKKTYDTSSLDKMSLQIQKENADELIDYKKKVNSDFNNWLLNANKKTAETSAKNFNKAWLEHQDLINLEKQLDVMIDGIEDDVIKIGDILASSMSSTIADGIQDGLDGDFDFGKLAESFSTSVGNAIAQASIAGAIQGTGIQAAAAANPWAGLAVGVGAMALGGLFGGDSGQSAAEKAEEKRQKAMDEFIDSIELAAARLEAFGNVGSATASALTSLEEELKSPLSALEELLEIQKTEIVGIYDTIHGMPDNTYLGALEAAGIEPDAKGRYYDAEVLNVVAINKETEQLQKTVDQLSKKIAEIKIDELSENLDLSSYSVERLKEVTADINREEGELVKARLEEIALLRKTSDLTDEQFIEEYGEELGKLFTNEHYQGVVDYADGFEAIDDAMAKSKANMEDWAKSFETQQETASRLINDVLVEVEKTGTRYVEKEVSKSTYDRVRGNKWRLKDGILDWDYYIQVQEEFTHKTYESADGIVQLATTWEELDALVVQLTEDTDGWDEASTNLLEANRALLEQQYANTYSQAQFTDSLKGTDEALKFASDQVDDFNGVLPTTADELIKLRQAFIDNDGVIDTYEQAIIDATLASDPFVEILDDTSSSFESLDDALRDIGGTIDDIIFSIKGITEEQKTMAFDTAMQSARNALMVGDTDKAQELIKVLSSTAQADVSEFTSREAFQLEQARRLSGLQSLQSLTDLSNITGATNTSDITAPAGFTSTETSPSFQVTATISDGSLQSIDGRLERLERLFMNVTDGGDIMNVRIES